MNLSSATTHPIDRAVAVLNQGTDRPKLFCDGQLYRGKIQDGKFHGKGTLSDKDGTVYEGDWKVGQYHGEGKLRDNTDMARPPAR